MTDVQEAPPDAATPGAPQASAAELAAEHGMLRAGARPALTTYSRELWRRRHFIVAFARARNAAGYSRSFLGQLWQVLTPLLNAGIYYVIFGLLLKTSRGTDNYIAFLVIGIFIFNFTSTSITSGARAVNGNLGLTRALHFPRATLPVSTTVISLQQLLVSLAVLLPIVVLTGEAPTWRWLLVVPALVLQTFFCMGMAFVFARVGARVPDTAQFLPFVIRTWLYLSGVFYNIQVFTKGIRHEWVKHLLEANPGAVYIELVRDALLEKHDLPSSTWPLAVGWAVVAFLGGFVYFWKAEERYGRE